jgi:hypothetical protein
MPVISMCEVALEAGVGRVCRVDGDAPCHFDPAIEADRIDSTMTELNRP